MGEARAGARAVQMTEEVVVPSLEGRAKAQPGDWVLRGPAGEMWLRPVENKKFTSTYDPIKPTAGPRPTGFVRGNTEIKSEERRNQGASPQRRK